MGGVQVKMGVNNHVRPLRGRISSSPPTPKPHVSASPHVGLTVWHLSEVLHAMGFIMWHLSEVLLFSNPHICLTRSCIFATSSTP